MLLCIQALEHGSDHLRVSATGGAARIILVNAEVITMCISHCSIGWNDSYQQLAQRLMLTQALDHLKMSLDPLIHLRDNDASHPKLRMPPAFPDVIDLVDDGLKTNGF